MKGVDNKAKLGSLHQRQRHLNFDLVFIDS
jgi:hypothetical protein